jgi:hypothetical protein
MSLVLRRIVWSDGYSSTDDYMVIHDGRKIGRIYRMDSTARELWLWTQINWGPSHGPNGGVADTLDDAKATFRRAWDSYHARAAT